MDVPVIGTRPAISLPPYTILGHRADGRPIYPIAGGAEGDGDSDVDMDDTTDDDAEDDTGADDEAVEGDDEAEPPKPAPKKDPALTRAEVEMAKLRAALKKSNDDAKRHRLALKEREERDRANEGDVEKALREAREEAENTWRPRIVNQAARAALAEAGGAGGPDRVLRLLDTQALSVDDDGDVIGLDSEIDRLKAEYPEFFAKPEAEKPKPKPRPTGAPKNAAPERPRSTAERIAAQVLGSM